MNCKGSGRERSWPNLRYYPSTHLDTLRKTLKILGQSGQLVSALRSEPFDLDNEGTPRHSSGSYLTAFHHGGPGSHPGHFMWHCNRFLSRVLEISCLIFPPWLHAHISEGWTTGPIGGRSSETQSHPTGMNNTSGEMHPQHNNSGMFVLFFDLWTLTFDAVTQIMHNWWGWWAISSGILLQSGQLMQVCHSKQPNRHVLND
jgi:hypothetical protein